MLRVLGPSKLNCAVHLGSYVYALITIARTVVSDHHDSHLNSTYCSFYCFWNTVCEYDSQPANWNTNSTSDVQDLLEVWGFTAMCEALRRRIRSDKVVMKSDLSQV
jgi:hypothetical protein